MSKVGDVVFCVDCDLARSEHLKVAVGDPSGASEVPPRRMATKKDASGDVLCTTCLDARVQRRRADFLKPSAPSVYAEPQPAVSSVSRPTAAALRGGASRKRFDTSARRFSSVRIERVIGPMPSSRSTKSQTAATHPKKQSKTAFVLSQSGDLSASEVVTAARASGIEMSPAYVHSIRSSAKRRKGAERKAGHPKGSKNRSGGAAAATVSGLKKAEAQLLAWIIEHGTITIQRMVDDLNERIRKLM